ncbi:MAG: NAD(P)-dependent alcohol dehydrogenase [Micrococcales bacterium]|nr:NAD(P)-dependent alcohol dehydrogenase [Micrococcales bacterium]
MSQTETPAPTMLAVVQDSYGTDGSLRVAEVERPVPGPGQVLVRVRAAGVSRATLHLLTGLPRVMRLATGIRRPRPRGFYSEAGALGLDVCGTVVAVGPAVNQFEAGQEVFGIARGSFAQYAVAAADRLALVPTTLSAPQAAVLAESGQTALQALDAASVDAGTRVLVLGASGGVGSLAVQLAAARGAEVTAVCSGAKTATVAGWGASRVVDYTAQDVTAEDGRYDAVLDIGGGTPLSRLRRVLTATGTIVFVGNETDQVWTGGFGRPVRNVVRMVFARQRFVMLTERDNRDDLERLAQAASDGQLVPHLHATFPLARAADALAELASGAVCGKVAIVTDETQ